MTALQNSQQVAEAVVAFNTGFTTAQVVAEALVVDDRKMEVTQVVAEVLLDPGEVNLDCSHFVIEAVIPYVPPGGNKPINISLLDNNDLLNRIKQIYRCKNIYRLYNPVPKDGE